MVEGEPYVKGVQTVVVKHRSGPPMMKSEKTAAFVERLHKLADNLGIHFEEKDRGGGSDGNHLSRCGSDPIVLTAWARTEHWITAKRSTVITPPQWIASTCCARCSR